LLEQPHYQLDIWAWYALYISILSHIIIIYSSLGLYQTHFKIFNQGVQMPKLNNLVFFLSPSFFDNMTAFTVDTLLLGGAYEDIVVVRHAPS